MLHHGRCAGVYVDLSLRPGLKISSHTCTRARTCMDAYVRTSKHTQVLYCRLLPSEKAYVLLIQNPIFADVMSEWQKWLSRYCISSCHVFLLLYHIIHVCRSVGLLICERLFAGFLLPVRMDIIAGQIQFEFYVSPHDAFTHAYVQEQAHALAHLSQSSDRAGCLKSCR